MKLVAIQITA